MRRASGTRLNSWKININSRIMYIFLVLLFGTLQTTIFSNLTFFGVKPLLLLALVVCVSLVKGGIDGGLIGLACGLFMDIMGGKTIGVNSLLFMYAGAATGFICGGFFNDKAIVAIFFTGIVTMCYGLIYYFMIFFIWGETRILAVLWRVMLPEVIYTAIIALPMFMLIRYMNRGSSRKSVWYH